jgi:Ca2+-binding EF-hand superfamily protein
MHRPVRRRLRTAARLSFVPSAYLAVGATLCVSGIALAQQTTADLTPGFSERLAFDAADTDGDGLVSEAELARDAAAGFSGLDVDRSGTLTPEELGPHDPGMFARVDANGDGVLSFSEVMAHKIRAFEQGDANGDGGLSFDEMVQSVRSELGVQQ